MSTRTEDSKKVWLAVVYQKDNGRRIGHSQFYSKRGLAVNWANKHYAFSHYARADVLEYDLSNPALVHSTQYKEKSS